MRLTEADWHIDRPEFGKPQQPVFGQVMGTLLIHGPEQAEFLQRVLEDAMRYHAGKHQETFLAALHKDVAAMRRRAISEGWTGWQRPAGRAALDAEGER